MGHDLLIDADQQSVTIAIISPVLD